ncbi:MAG: hypothetical protein RL846_30750 [Deltaproteobacteria bacterium]
MNRRPSTGLLVVFAGFTFACGDAGTTVRVVSPYNTTQGMSGVRVRANEGAWVTADADGSVTFEDVSTPYLLDIEQSYETTLRTSDDPDGLDATLRDLWRLTVIDEAFTFEVDDYAPPSEDACTVSGRVALGEGERAQLEVSHLQFGLGSWQTETPEFEADLRYVVQSPKLGVYAVAGVPDADDAFYASISGAGHIDVDLPSGPCGTLANVDVPLQPVTSRAVDVAYDSPDVAGLEQISGFANLRFDDMPAVSIHLGGVYGDPPDGTFTPQLFNGFGQPWVGFSSFGQGTVVDGDAADFTKRWRYFVVQSPYAYAAARVDAGVDAITLAAPAPTNLLAPDDGADLTTSTAFSWHTVSDVDTYVFEFHCRFVGKSAGNLAFRMHTPATEVTLPAFVYDRVQPGMRCAWSVGYVLESDTAVRSAYTGERWVKDPR